MIVTSPLLSAGRCDIFVTLIVSIGILQIVPGIFSICPRGMIVTFLKRSLFAINTLSSFRIPQKCEGKLYTSSLFDTDWQGTLPFTIIYGKFYKYTNIYQMRKHLLNWKIHFLYFPQNAELTFHKDIDDKFDIHKKGLHEPFLWIFNDVSAVSSFLLTIILKLFRFSFSE